MPSHHTGARVHRFLDHVKFRVLMAMHDHAFRPSPGLDPAGTMGTGVSPVRSEPEFLQSVHNRVCGQLGTEAFAALAGEETSNSLASLARSSRVSRRYCVRATGEKFLVGRLKGRRT